MLKHIWDFRVWLNECIFIKSSWWDQTLLPHPPPANHRAPPHPSHRQPFKTRQLTSTPSLSCSCLPPPPITHCLLCSKIKHLFSLSPLLSLMTSSNKAAAYTWNQKRAEIPDRFRNLISFSCLMDTSHCIFFSSTLWLFSLTLSQKPKIGLIFAWLNWCNWKSHKLIRCAFTYQSPAGAMPMTFKSP